MPSPGGQFLSDEFGDIEDYFVSDYWLIDQYIGDTLWTWGFNGVGELGANIITDRSTPVTTFTGGTNWKQVSFGFQNVAAVKTDGTLWTWGSNGSGGLGVNDTTARRTPVTTSLGGTNWKSVGSGSAQTHTAAIKTDGTLWIWGANSNGGLGINNTINRSTPVTTFLGGNDWKSVASGTRFTAAIKTDGTLWVWGDNQFGKLGTNDAIDRSTPVTTSLGGTNWRQVSCGTFHMAAIKDDGTLWTWGNNNSGELGINSTIDRSTPVTTSLGGTNWKQVNAGNGHISAIKTDKTLWTWGSNDNGQLGINDTIDRSTPVTTSLGGTNWKSVGSGSGHTAAIKTDGTLWVWGNNSNGGLGINNTIDRSTPVTTFLGGNNWKQVSVSGSGSGATTALTAGSNVNFL